MLRTICPPKCSLEQCALCYFYLARKFVASLLSFCLRRTFLANPPGKPNVTSRNAHFDSTSFYLSVRASHYMSTQSKVHFHASMTRTLFCVSMHCSCLCILYHSQIRLATAPNAHPTKHLRRFARVKSGCIFSKFQIRFTASILFDERLFPALR